MVKYVTLFLLILLHQSLSAQTTTLRLDPDNARGGTASQVFDSIRFIPLETTKESVFGSVDQLEVTDSLFIILAVSSRSILLFKRNGKFITKIITGGIDKYFYRFTLDRVRNEIAVMNNFANSLLVYDFQGKFLRKEPCPDGIESLYRLSDKTIIYYLSRSIKLEPTDHIRYNLAYSSGYDSITKYLKPYNAKNAACEYNSDGSIFNFSGESGSCMFSMPFEYTIYQLNDTGILHQYQFVFPLRYSLPLNFSTDPVWRGKRMKYAYNTPGNESVITALQRGYRWGDYLLFTIFNLQLMAGADRNYAYNLKSNSLISFSRVTGDSSSYYLPILSSGFEQVDALYDHTIFSAIPSFEVFAVKNKIDKKITYPETLRQYFTTGNKNDNPAIIQLQLKPNL